MQKVNQRSNTDCVRACVASILEMHIDDVPDFNPVDWYSDLRTWLGSKIDGPSYVPMNTIVVPDFEIPAYGIGGVSIPGNKWQHAVVTFGNEIRWDPGEHLNLPNGQLVEICYFVAVDPS